MTVGDVAHQRVEGIHVYVSDADHSRPCPIITIRLVTENTGISLSLQYLAPRVVVIPDNAVGFGEQYNSTQLHTCENKGQNTNPWNVHEELALRRRFLRKTN